MSQYEVTDNSTQHGFNTPFGFNTPHRHPQSEEFKSSIMNFIKLMYPTGRAFNIPENSNFEKLHTGINEVTTALLGDAFSFFDSVFPDNENFTAEDAAIWERRLGLISISSLNLNIRRAAIFRKLRFPGNVAARQHRNYIEDQLRQAGFNIRIYPNVPPFQLPSDIVNIEIPQTQHGDDLQHGLGSQHGGANFELIANSLERNESFSTGGNLSHTFFISGDTLETPAEILESRITEFRELVLKLKPANTVAFVIANYN